MSLFCDVRNYKQKSINTSRKIYNFLEIHRLCQNIQRDIFNIDSGVRSLIKGLLQRIKANLDRVTWIQRNELTQSKNILQQILTSY